jgi:xanthine dehydrogenase accessory factor
MANDVYEEIIELRSKGIRSVLATIIAGMGATPRKDAAKMLIREDGSKLGSIGGGSIEPEVLRQAGIVMKTGKPQLLNFDLTAVDPEESAFICGGQMEVYLEPIFPDPTLILFGTGHVAKALSGIAKTIGFRIIVVDDRVKYANSERFPQADEFCVDAWESAVTKLHLSNCSYILIATRGNQYDLICLRAALNSTARYVSMLGNKKKLKLLSDLLEKEGMDPSNFERVSVPVGFDIGSETPEEIAVSIAAELIAVRKNRDLFSLKEALSRANTAAGAAHMICAQ